MPGKSAAPPRRASITIRNLDPALKRKLRLRAAQHGRSMEAEARELLQEGLATSEPSHEPHLADRIHALFAPLGGLDIEIQPRSETKPRPLPKFD